MFHTNKGIVGARFDGIEDVKINNLIIKDLVNESPLVSCACGSYMGENDGGSPGQEDDEGGMGTDIRGIAISRGDVEIIGNQSLIANLDSYYGDTVGLDIFNGAIVDYDTKSDITVYNLISGSQLTICDYIRLINDNKTPFPNNFDSCTISIESTSHVIGDIPKGKNVTDCTQWNRQK